MLGMMLTQDTSFSVTSVVAILVASSPEDAVMKIMIAALLGALGMILARCLTIEEAYKAIDWKIIFLLGGILPLGLALEQNGAALWIANSINQFSASFGPVAILAIFYIAHFTRLNPRKIDSNEAYSKK